MKPKILGSLIVGLALCGCGKHAETPAPNPTASSATENLPQPAAAPTAPSASPANAPEVADLPALSRELRGWIVGHRRLPASFEEFVSSANLKVPPPPPGKKYAINKSTVVLVDR